MSKTSPFIPFLLGILLTGCESGSIGELPLTELPVPATVGSGQPHLAGSTPGPVVLSWLEPATSGHALRFSTGVDSGWSPARTVASGANWLQNWADFPSVVPLGRQIWGAHWLVRRPGGAYAYDVAVAISADGGETWGRHISPHDDGTATEHGFVSLFPRQDGLGVLWLDGRNTVTDIGGTSLRSALVSPQGAVHAAALVDDLVCDCCQTDVAVAATGPVAVYRNRTQNEFRDIYAARMISGRWESGRSVAEDGWKIDGCPVNGPSVAARDNAVVVAWYTGAGPQPTIRIAFSSNSAESFDPPLEVVTGAVMGRVNVGLLDDGDAIVSWVANARNETGAVIAEIRARRISPTGSIGTSYLIAETGAGRPSGFPQMLVDGEQLIFAWTDTRAASSRVRAARLAATEIR